MEGGEASLTHPTFHKSSSINIQHTVHVNTSHVQRVTAATPFRLSSLCSAGPGGRTRNGGQTSVSMSTPGSAARARAMHHSSSQIGGKDDVSQKQAGTDVRGMSDPPAAVTPRSLIPKD